MKLDAGQSPTLARGCATSHWRDKNQFFRESQQKLVATATFLDGSKTNFISFMYSNSSTKLENLT